MAAILKRADEFDSRVLEFRVSASYGENEVLHDVSGELRRGEVLSVVGLSGSGKSTLALALLGLLRYRGGAARGSVRLCGQELTGLRERELRPVRGRLAAYVPQNAASALNGRMRIRKLLEETWRAHRRERPAADFWSELLASVQLPGHADFLDRRAEELSTGQGQRLLIALAIMHEPALLIADEPTSALDAITQAAILDLFRDLNAGKGIAMLFISHDLLSVAQISSRVAILHEGRVVETGDAARVFAAPEHEFTKRLVGAALKTAPLVSGGSVNALVSAPRR